MSSTTPAGWYPDPYNAAQLRYWDGAVWTESTAPVGGQAGSDATQQIVTDQTQSYPTGLPAGANPYDAAQGTGPGNQPPGAAGYPTPGQTGSVPGAGGTADQWAAPSGPPSLDGFGQGTAAPGTGSATWGGGAVAQPAGAGLGDVSHWLSSIFQKLVSQLVPILLLLFVLPAVFALLTAVLAERLLSGIVLDLEPDSDLDFEIVGFSGGLFALLVLFSLALLVVGLVARLAANHQLYAAHAGAPRSVGASLSTAVRRLPRAILWGIALVLLLWFVVAVFTLLLLIVVGLSVGGTAGDASPLFALLVVPIVVLGMVFGAWLWAKLAFFLTALAVGPAGTNPFSASWEMSRGRFWPVFGRLALVAVALWVLWGLFNAIFQPIFGSAAADIFQVDVVTGDLLVDGQNIDTLNEIRWADVIPGPAWFAVVAVLYTLGRAVVDAIWTSATTGLYWRGGGRGEV